jgi:[ribosomal protein S5]-alanine N-acetyltransferase
VVIAETERLTLRQFTWDDLEEVAAIKADPEVMKYIGTGQPLTPDQVRDLFSRWIEDGEYGWSAQTLQRVPQLYRAVERNAHFSSWAMINKNCGKLIGRCGLHAWNLDGQLEVEVGYLLARPYWGQGLATEAARSVRDYAFNRLGFERLIAIICPENIASQRVALKLGMRCEHEAKMKERAVQIFSMSSKIGG